MEAEPVWNTILEHIGEGSEITTLHIDTRHIIVHSIRLDGAAGGGGAIVAEWFNHCLHHS